MMSRVHVILFTLFVAFPFSSQSQGLLDTLNRYKAIGTVGKSYMFALLPKEMWENETNKGMEKAVKGVIVFPNADWVVYVDTVCAPSRLDSTLTMASKEIWKPVFRAKQANCLYGDLVYEFALVNLTERELLADSIKPLQDKEEHYMRFFSYYEYNPKPYWLSWEAWISKKQGLWKREDLSMPVYRNDTFDLFIPILDGVRPNIVEQTCCGGGLSGGRNGIWDIEEALKKMGYDIVPNGKLDEEDKQALISFQKKHRIPVGSFNPQTIKLLNFYIEKGSWSLVGE